MVTARRSCAFMLTACWLSASLGGCASSPAEAPTADAAVRPLFYPSPPNQPRLQFLAKYSSALDVSAKSQGFRDFVFGGEENEGHLVQKPYGLALFEGAIYVVDTRGNGYGVFDLGNRRSRMVRPGGAGAMQKPINITIDADGTRYVTDTGREQILVFDRNDRFLKAFGETGQYRPVDVAIIGDRLYVTDVLHHEIHALDKRSGEVLLTFGGAGSEPGQLFHPTNLAVGPDNTLYVAETSNFRIQQFDAGGRYLRTIGEIGTVPGKFSRPKGIALDRHDRLYAVDAAFENVQIMDPEGLPLMYFGQPGEGRDNINMPTVVKIDYDNVVYFQQFADPNFDIEYLVLVASQFGLNKVVVFGFGSYDEEGGRDSGSGSD